MSVLRGRGNRIDIREIRKKFKRAIKRLLQLSRAARKQGNFDFNIGSLVFEVAQETQFEESTKTPTAWIEVVIN